MKIKLGDKVFWEDPDEGQSSGKYVIIQCEDYDIESPDDMFLLRNEYGSETEVPRHEITLL